MDKLWLWLGLPGFILWLHGIRMGQLAKLRFWRIPFKRFGMSEMKQRLPHKERCRQESTRDVIFLFQYRHSKRSKVWHTESVFLTREEGEEFGQAHAYRWPGGWQVYGICAEGELAKLLRTT